MIERFEVARGACGRVCELASPSVARSDARAIMVYFAVRYVFVTGAFTLGLPFLACNRASQWVIQGGSVCVMRIELLL